jgi:hypothetical protein
MARIVQTKEVVADHVGLAARAALWQSIRPAKQHFPGRCEHTAVEFGKVAR